MLQQRNMAFIRFYNDREVRAVWDEEQQKWCYSVLDAIGAFNMQDDYKKNRNWLDLIFKRSLKKCVDWSKINKKELIVISI